MMTIDQCVHAHAFAKKRHDATGAVRRHSGIAYIHHPEQVAKIVEAWGGDRDQIVVAYLHDTVEDTSATLDIINKKFGGQIASYVGEITNNKEMIKRIGKEEYINRELVGLSSKALLVKLADMYSNMLDFPAVSQSDRMYRNIKYLQANRFNMTSAQEDLINEIKIAYICR